MDDMQAIEQRVTRELLRRAGPSEPVDDAAIFTAVTATQSPKWRFQSMFSATKFVVAGAVLALFGGFLLTGVLTQPSEDRPPVVGASASATTQTESTEATTSEPEPTQEVEADDSTTTSPDLLPGVDLVTEQVEPGVYRVVSDGVREISVLPADEARYMGGILDTNIAAGPDGSVWLFGLDGFFRLGADVTHGWHEDFRRHVAIGQGDFEVGPDGTIWLHHFLGPRKADNANIWSFDGGAWTTRRQGARNEWLLGVEVRDDGTVWTAWHSDTPSGKSKPEPRVTVARLGADGWEELPGSVDSPYWQGDLVIAGGGGDEVLLMADPEGPLRRHDGNGWVRVQTPEAGGRMRVAVGADGTLWARLDRDGLARFDGEAWEVFGPDDGIPMMGDHYQGFEGSFEVAPDRTVWFNPIGDYQRTGTECDGIANFDGQVLRRYLRDHCISAMDMAPDGTVWLRAATQLKPDQNTIIGTSEWVPTDLIHTYVITPDAVAQ